MLRFVKLDVVRGTDLCNIQYKLLCNQLSYDQLNIGEQTRNALKLVKNKHQGLMLSVRSFYSSAVEYLMAKLPLQNSIVMDVHCLNPARIHEFVDGVEIARLARQLKGRITTEDVTLCIEE